MRVAAVPLFTLVGIVLIFSGCHRGGKTSPRIRANSREATSTYQGRGLLREVSADGRKAVIEHDAITGYMHLFVLREPDFSAFAHLHPVRRDGATFENVLPPLPAGSYQLYAEITSENGLNQTLTARVDVPAPRGPALPPVAYAKMVNELWCRSPGVPLGNAGQPFALDADDSCPMSKMRV